MPDPASRTRLKATALRFADLFHKGRFTVPWHQRYYDWDAPHVRALLDDLDEAMEDNQPCYFLGAVILVPTNSGCWQINDGQQRMITISLLCAALARRLAEDNPGSQREGQALRMIFDRPATDVLSMADAEDYPPRITPTKNNQMQYRQMIRGHSIGTNGKLTAAWREIEGFLGTARGTTHWAAFFDFVRDRLEVACLEVPPVLDPNTIFETINSRGKQLDDLDRLRNFIYAHFNAGTTTARRTTVHDCLELIRTNFPTPARATAYLRCRLQCRYGLLGSTTFYRNARKAIRTQGTPTPANRIPASDYVFSLTQELASREDIGLYQAITATTPDPVFVDSFKKARRTGQGARSVDDFLVELKDYKVTQPLVFALLARFVNETDTGRKHQAARAAHTALRHLTTFVMRTAFVAKFEPSHFERDFSTMAQTIATASAIDLDEFTQFLRTCDRDAYGVLNDKKFVSLLDNATMTGAIKIKRFLVGINRHGRPDSQILNATHCNIEHILPKADRHHQTWTAFGQDAADWVHRIGNLTLLARADNKPGDRYNSSFAKKKPIYRTSSIAITRTLGTFRDWSPDRIAARQKKMARIATEVWRSG